MAALATTADVEARLQRPLTTVEQLAAAVFLDEVSAMVRRAVPTVDTLMGSDPDYAAVVTGRVAAAVVRVLRNPDGKISETIDDYAYRRADAVADGALYLSVDDLTAIRPVVTNSRVGSQKLAARGYGPSA